MKDHVDLRFLSEFSGRQRTFSVLRSTWEIFSGGRQSAHLDNSHVDERLCLHSHKGSHIYMCMHLYIDIDTWAKSVYCIWELIGSLRRDGTNMPMVCEHMKVFLTGLASTCVLCTHTCSYPLATHMYPTISRSPRLSDRRLPNCWFVIFFFFLKEQLFSQLPKVITIAFTTTFTTMILAEQSLCTPFQILVSKK